MIGIGALFVEIYKGKNQYFELVNHGPDFVEMVFLSCEGAKYVLINCTKIEGNELEL